MSNRKKIVKIKPPKKPRLPSPKTYNEFIKNLEIKDIFLKQLSATYNTESLDQPANISVSMSANYFNYSPDFIKVYHKYLITLRGKGSTENNVDIKCSFVVVYRSQIKMTDSFFRVFRNLNLRVNTWPYMRELVHNTLKRMNIDAVIAPTYKIP